VRWNELKDNAAFQAGKSVLINSTDVRKSNRAAMYLALASYIVNQGLQEDSSAGQGPANLSCGSGAARAGSVRPTAPRSQSGRLRTLAAG
jgi:hypothetical protein